jgi:hypothetical protein
MRLVSHLMPFMAKHSCAKAHCNGSILPSVRVACALRYFAGGSPYDVVIVFGVAVSEVFESAWEVAVNKVSAFDIQFPTSHEKQHEISQGFKNKSDANF